MIKVEVVIGTIRTSEVEATLEMIGVEVNIVEVKGASLRIETGHMTEVEAGIDMIEKDLG